MKQHITEEEKIKILDLVFNNPQKSCAIVQCFIDSLQLVSPAEFAELKGKSKRTIQYRVDKMRKVSIANRNYLTLIQ